MIRLRKIENGRRPTHGELWHAVESCCNAGASRDAIRFADSVVSMATRINICSSPLFSTRFKYRKAAF